MDTLNILQQLFEAFPNSKGTEATAAIYYRMLRDVPAEELQIVADQCIAECRFLPTIAEILERYRFLSHDAGVPTPEEEWEKVMQQIRAVGHWAAPTFDNEITRRVVKAMDWATLCHSENLIADRRQFLDLYRGIAKRGEQVSKLLPEARQMAERKAGLLPVGDVVKQLMGDNGSPKDEPPF